MVLHEFVAASEEFVASGMDLFSQAGICVCMQGFVAGQGFVAADRDL